MTAEPASPFGVEVLETADKLLITRRWFQWTSLPVGLFALVWIGITLNSSGDDLLNICTGLFVGVGLFALYVTALSLVNRTTIEIDQQELTIHHGPLPSLSKHHRVPVEDINQLVLKGTKTSSGNLSGSGSYWDLNVVDRFGGERKLIGTMPNGNQAEYIRQEMERFLQRLRSEE